MIDHLDTLRSRPKPTPERSLWNAVVFQAVVDLFGTPRGGPTDLEGLRLTALQWLTAESGEDADGRDYACSLAGIDGDELRRRVILALDGGDISVSHLGAAADALRLEDARALWRAHRDRPKVRKVAFVERHQPEVIAQDGPFPVNSFGAIFYRGDDLPGGLWRGHYIPSTRTGPGRVLYALTRPHGGNLRKLRTAHMKDWEGLASALCSRFSLDLVWLRDGQPSTEADPDAKAYLIPRPISTSIAA